MLPIFYLFIFLLCELDQTFMVSKNTPIQVPLQKLCIRISILAITKWTRPYNVNICHVTSGQWSWFWTMIFLYMMIQVPRLLLTGALPSSRVPVSEILDFQTGSIKWGGGGTKKERERQRGMPTFKKSWPGNEVDSHLQVTIPPCKGFSRELP